jgi:transposase-like protein
LEGGIYLWSVVDADSGEIIAVYVFKERFVPNAFKFLRKVLDAAPIGR